MRNFLMHKIHAGVYLFFISIFDIIIGIFFINYIVLYYFVNINIKYYSK